MSQGEKERQLSSVDYDLSSRDEEVRRLAIEGISVLEEADALPRLGEGLGDGSWRVRKAAMARILALRDETAANGLLIDALSDGENSGRRNAAVQALMARGVSVVPRLVVSLDAPDVDVRKQLVDVLAGIGDDSVESEIRALLVDPDPNVAGAAADALGVIGGAASAADLVAVVTSGQADRLLRASALGALARLELPVDVENLEPLLDDRVLRPPALEALSISDDPGAHELLLKWLGEASPSTRNASVAGLLRVIGRADPDAAVRLVERVRESVGSQPAVVERLLESMQGADLSLQMSLIQFLGLTGDERVVVPILGACADEAVAELAHATLAALGDVAARAIEQSWEGLSSALRCEAVGALARAAGSVGGEVLARACTDNDPTLRVAAIEAFGARQMPEAIPPLVARLEAAGAQAAGDIGEELPAIVDALAAIAEGERGNASEVVRALTVRLESAADPVRLAVAQVLGRVGTPQDEPHIAHLLRDPSPEVRRSAVGALSRLSGSGTREPLRLALADESPVVRCAAAVALGQSGDEEVFDDLVRLHLDRTARVRAAAARAMGRHGARHPDCYEAAVEHLRSLEHDDATVVIAAAEALCELGGAGAVAVATDLLENPTPEVVLAAVTCIGRHGTSESLVDLMALTGHADWTVRAEVIQTLGQRSFVRAVPVILRRLESEQDGFVRDTILAALSRLEG